MIDMGHWLRHIFKRTVTFLGAVSGKASALQSYVLIGLSPDASEILDFYCYQIVTPEKEKLEISVYFFFCYVDAGAFRVSDVSTEEKQRLADSSIGGLDLGGGRSNGDVDVFFIFLGGSIDRPWCGGLCRR